MLIELKTAEISLVVEVSSNESTAGALADLLVRVLNGEGARAQVREQSAHIWKLNELESHLVGQDDVKGDVTLWWAKKPLPRELSLITKFGSNSRTRIVVGIGPTNPNASVEISNISQSSRVRLKDASEFSPSKRTVEAIAAEIAKDLHSIPLDAKMRLITTTRGCLTPDLRRTLSDVITSENPRKLLRQKLDSDLPLRRFADQVLSTIGKAEIKDGVVVFTEDFTES